MLVSETDPHLPDAGSPSAGMAGSAAHPYLALPAEMLPYLHQLRVALALYRLRGRATELEDAFAAAAVVVGAVLEPTAGRPDLDELRQLATSLPEFGELLSSAAEEAERVVCAGAVGLWAGLSLRSTAPTWTSAEREAARMVFACACAPSGRADLTRLQGGLRALAAGRFAALLCRELAESEEAWTKALGPRYDSVRHRCARRTTWRSLGLSELLRTDESSQRAVTARLERWMSAGGILPALAGELEAALVHARTPARFA